MPKEGSHCQNSHKAVSTTQGNGGAVALLASHDASYITGVEINVDGGMGQI